MAGSILRLRAAVAAAGCRQFASSSACLMLPSNKMMYSPGEKKVVNINSNIEKESESDQVVGSSHGWVGLFKTDYKESSSSSSSVSVWNPMSGDHIKLPPIHTIINPDWDWEVRVEKLIVDDAECSRVVIVSSSLWLGVCCPGRCSEWTLFQREKQNHDVVVCSQRKFYILHQSELVKWNISEPWRPRAEWRCSLSEIDYAVHRHDEHQFPRKQDRAFCHSLPHLVYAEHSDQLFIVTRHFFYNTGPDGSGIDPVYSDIYPYMTIGFDVHLVEVESSGKRKLRYMKHSLDGLVMFVGLNDSFAVPAADFPHLKSDSIYFTDHHKQSRLLPFLPDEVHGGHDVGIYDYQNEIMSSCYYPNDHHCFKRSDSPLTGSLPHQPSDQSFLYTCMLSHFLSIYWRNFSDHFLPSKSHPLLLSELEVFCLKT